MKTQQRKGRVDKRFLRAVAVVDEVDKLYPTENACFKELWRRIRRHKRCQFCNSANLKPTSKRTGNCGKCGKKFWLTAGTTFDRARCVRPYLVAIKLIERGVVYSARLLSRLCSIAYDTAWQIRKKIMVAVLPAMPRNSVLVSSFEFDQVVCKRSFETEARQHPVSEQESVRREPKNTQLDPFLNSVTRAQKRDLADVETAVSKRNDAVPSSVLQSITIWCESRPQPLKVQSGSAHCMWSERVMTSALNPFSINLLSWQGLFLVPGLTSLRSRHAIPAGHVPFCSNVETNDVSTMVTKMSSDALSSDKQNVPSQKDAEKLVYDSLSRGPQSLDALIALTGLSSSAVIAAVAMLELGELISFTDGNRVALSAKYSNKPLQPLLPYVQDCVSSIIKFLKKNFHGVSRRYIQLYLAAHWSFVDRDRWAAGAVLNHCCLPFQRVRNFVSPVELQVWTG
ncbi:MAG TPA: hypothetical protein V6C89_19225 [Drouetiella sp.]